MITFSEFYILKSFLKIQQLMNEAKEYNITLELFT